MNRILTAGLILAASLTLGAVSATLAMAEEPQWLLNGAVVTSEKPATGEGEMTFSDSKATGGAVKIDCSIQLLGDFGPGRPDRVTNEEGLTLPAEELWVDCLALQRGACPELIRMMAFLVPYPTMLSREGEEFRDATKAPAEHTVGYDMNCIVLGIEVTDECTGETTEKITNGTGGVNWAFDGKSGKLNCSQGGAGAGAIEGSGTETSSEGTLSVS